MEYETYEESWTGRIAIAAVIALALIAGAFFAGRALAGESGPATLAEAVQQARSGELPCGETAEEGAAGGAGAPGSAGEASGTGQPGAAGGTGRSGGAAGSDGGAAGSSSQPGTAGAGQPGAAGGPPGGSFPLGALCEDGDRQQPQGTRGRLGGGQTGQVTAVGKNSITLTGPMGETTVALDAQTTINKSASGKVADIKAGDSVLVAGATQGAATSVTILPAGGT